MVTKHSTLVLEPEPKTKTKPKPKLCTRRKKNRTKLRKPKYLSLRLQLTATTPQQTPMPSTTTSQNQNHDENKLINFFPLHPENLMEQDKLDVSCIFSSCDDDQANTTLTGILCSDDEEDIEQKISIDTDKNSSPSSVNYADEERNLVRTAMRRNIIKKEQDDHEKWVSYNEVVDRNKVVMRGMSSSSSSTTSCYYNNHHVTTSDHGHVRNNNGNNKLVLKLDYEKIMKSWVNKGPLYISGLDAPPQPQTVPDIRDDDFFFPTSINGSTHDERDIGGNDGSLWTVPQLEGDDALRVAGSSAVVHNREASVQRYKEKRRNRLFAKTIRYEVRKLNAEKRPRIKGRFVKRD